MIDVALLRHDPDVLTASLQRRGLDVDVPALVDLDRNRREVRSGAEELRARQKEIGKSIPGLDGAAREAAIAEAA
ncbi:MAG TPA: serine--tRNA ligase, partial [Acidimicrobiia bacterium]|nr:serine--tRNA ligase [Acidimicrobiia bacterium]